MQIPGARHECPDLIRGVLTFGRLIGATGPVITGLLLASGAGDSRTLLVSSAAPLVAIAVLSFSPLVTPAGPREPAR